MKLTAKKLRMTQIWQGDIVVPVTLLKVEADGDMAGIEAGKLVAVSGIIKGHGFAGVVKRHNFGGGPKTHGQKNRFRAPGSIGNTAAQRVIPGRRMAGHMGHVKMTVKNLLVAAVNAETREVSIRGAVPGPRKGTVEISA